MMYESDEDIAAARLGTTIGNWTLERVLGIGGMASVFAGRHQEGYHAAIKLLHPYLSNIPEIKKRFMREGPISNALLTLGPLCSSFVRTYETGVTDDGAVFIVMEMLSGETAFDAMARTGPLSVHRVLRIAHKVLDALVVAHTYGIVHRDLKPENIHLGSDKDETIKVLDFGIARVTDTLPEGTGDLPEKTATKAGIALGSGEYMAPEQARGKVDEIDGRTDIFGLGATMFRLLTARAMHGDLSDASVLAAAATMQAPPISSVFPELPYAVAAVVDLALSFQKTARYPNAATMRHDIRNLREGKAPPYVLAIAEGRIVAGDPLKST